MFVQAVKQLADHTGELGGAMVETINKVLTTDKERSRLAQLRDPIGNLTAQMNELLELNARATKHKRNFPSVFEELVTRRDRLEIEEAALTASIEDKEQRWSSLLAAYKELQSQDDGLEFTPRLWVSLIEHATVGEDGITFQFKDGHEVTRPIWPASTKD